MAAKTNMCPEFALIPFSEALREWFISNALQILRLDPNHEKMHALRDADLWRQQFNTLWAYLSDDGIREFFLIMGDVLPYENDFDPSRLDDTFGRNWVRLSDDGKSLLINSFLDIVNEARARQAARTNLSGSDGNKKTLH